MPTLHFWLLTWNGSVNKIRNWILKSALWHLKAIDGIVSTMFAKDLSAELTDFFRRSMFSISALVPTHISLNVGKRLAVEGNWLKYALTRQIGIRFYYFCYSNDICLNPLIDSTIWEWFSLYSYFFTRCW